MADKGFKGLDKLLKKLKDAGSKLPEKIGVVVQANANEMAQTARRLAPIDKGKLRQSIRKTKVNDLEAKVTAGVKYAAYQEFGTGGLVDVPPELEDIAIKFKGRGIRRIDMRPQPFMYPALTLQRPKLLEDLEKLLDKELGKL